jgi:hypothetical protein
MVDPVTTAVAPAFEERNIVMVQGLDFTNARLREKDRDPTMVVPDTVKKRLPDLQVPRGDLATYFNKKQGVQYNVQVTSGKDQFKRYLQVPKLFLIYGGHARMGRGPCFGDDIFHQPGEQWENGSDPKTEGLFRMGYPYVPIPVSDVLEHGYTAYPVPSSVTLTKSDCHPLLQASYGKLKPMTLTQLEAQLGSKDPYHRPRWRIDDPDQLFKPFWGADFSGVTGKVERHAVLFAGWNKTVNAPMDLGATDVRSRVLCIFSCSSQLHFAKILRERKQWQQQGDDGYAFFTTDTSFNDIAGMWIYHMMTYNKFNAKQSIKDLLEYTKNHTNMDLANAGRSYRVASS